MEIDDIDDLIDAVAHLDPTFEPFDTQRFINEIARVSQNRSSLLLEQLTNHPHFFIRRLTISVLIARARLHSVPIMLPLLHHADAGIRRDVSSALSEVFDPRIVAALKERLVVDPDFDVRNLSAQSLAHLLGVAAIPVLLKYVSTEQQDVEVQTFYLQDISQLVRTMLRDWSVDVLQAQRQYQQVHHVGTAFTITSKVQSLATARASRLFVDAHDSMLYVQDIRTLFTPPLLIQLHVAEEQQHWHYTILVRHSQAGWNFTSLSSSVE